MIYAVVGSRHYHNFSFIEDILNQFVDITEIVTGDAKGVDQLAETYAQIYNIPIKIFYAEWKRYGKAAGPIRNILVAQYCEKCIAFPVRESKGTFDVIRKVEGLKKPVYIYYAKIE